MLNVLFLLDSLKVINNLLLNASKSMTVIVRSALVIAAIVIKHTYTNVKSIISIVIVLAIEIIVSHDCGIDVYIEW